MTATQYWTQRFDEAPKTDSEKLAVAMMAEFRNELIEDEVKWLRPILTGTPTEFKPYVEARIEHLKKLMK